MKTFDTSMISTSLKTFTRSHASPEAIKHITKNNACMAVYSVPMYIKRLTTMIKDSQNGPSKRFIPKWQLLINELKGL